jgi:RNA polymerase sigma factor (TIGR02999 family)
MSDVTQILTAIDAGDPAAAAQLLPLVYEELRTLAAQRLANEKPGQTLQATALVHEAFLRLVGNQRFDGRHHFFAAAAEAMRRILIDRARARGRVRRGGGRNRIPLDEIRLATDVPNDDLLDIDEAIGRLAQLDPVRAELVKLRFFAGLTMSEAAATLDLSVATAERYWAFARAWLHAELTRGDE